jgi:hypothetical protein
MLSGKAIYGYKITAIIRKGLFIEHLISYVMEQNWKMRPLLSK